MDTRKNTTMAWPTNLTTTNSESRDWFNCLVPNFVTSDLVFGVMISIIFLVTACFFYVFRSIHARGFQGTSNDPNNVQLGSIARVPIETHVVPNNTSNSSSYLKCPENAMHYHPGHSKTSNSSSTDYSNDLIAYQLKMRLEKITHV